jgi:hypothetical protein
VKPHKPNELRNARKWRITLEEEEENIKGIEDKKILPE